MTSSPDSPQLLFVPPPKSGESLSSWLCRTAEASGVLPQQLLNLCFPGSRSWSLDLDRPISTDWFESLATATGQTAENLRRLSLPVLETLIVERSKVTSARTPWVIPLARNQDGKARGSQFCPECLAQDEWPYLRLQWRLAFVTVCPVHPEWVLLDCCPACQAVLRPFHQRSIFMPGQRTLGLDVCTRCGFWLPEGSRHPSRQRSGLEDMEWLMGFIQSLLSGVHSGWIELPGGEQQIMMIPFLRGFHQLLRLLGTTPEAQPLREWVDENINLKGDLVGARQKSPAGGWFERMTAWDRHLLMVRGGWLLQTWPNRFVEVGHHCHLTYSTLLQDMESPPYWLWRQASDHFRTLYGEWRDPTRPKREQYSYNALSARKQSARLFAYERRLDFLLAHESEWGNVRALAQLMKQAGLYSPKTDICNIAKHIPKLIREAPERRHWWHIVGHLLGPIPETAGAK